MLSFITSVTPYKTIGVDETAEVLTIKSKEEFLQFADLVNRKNEPQNFYQKTVELKTDIDLGGEKFSPIGNGETYFSGTFKGNNHTISNVSIEGDSFVGLFGVIDHAVIQDLNLNNVSIRGCGDIGSLVGQSVFSQILNCHVTNLEMHTMDAAGNDNSVYMGGLVGYNNADISVSYFEEFSYDDPVALIDNCSTSGNIFVDSAFQYGSIGGLVGVNHGGSDASRAINSLAKISNCRSSVNITGRDGEHETELPVAMILGGLVGSNCDYNSIAEKGALIDKCFSTGNVDAKNVNCMAWTGGLVGYQFNYKGNAVIKNSGFEGNVYGAKALFDEGGFSNTGGFIGENGAIESVSNVVTSEMTPSTENLVCNSSIENCYCLGTVGIHADDNLHLGGFIGVNSSFNTNTQILNCYSANEIKSIFPTTDYVAVGNFGAINIVSPEESETKYSCNLKCYYNSDLNEVNDFGIIDDSLRADVVGLSTSECKSDNGLIKMLNDNITSFSKGNHWCTWSLNASASGYPTNNEAELTGGNKFGVNTFVVLGSACLVLIILIFIIYKKKRKV